MNLKPWIYLAGVCSIALACAQQKPNTTPANQEVVALAKKSSACEGVPVQEEVREVADGVWVAYGYDLANTILIQTSEGNVIIDAMSGPKRAAKAKEALLEKAPGKTLALIMTHTHMDHVGGASVWADAETPIWATHNFVERFTAQYVDFPKAERHRGAKQHAHDVPYDAVPCSSIGARMAFDEDISAGAMMPTKTFRGSQTLTFGDTVLELHEAPGETDDQLLVWMPKRKILFPGDNYYAAFPNLYTIRGTKARSAKKWANSLDKMRMLAPQLLVPSHSFAVEGTEKIYEILTDYRDAIMWVFQRVVQGANNRLPLDTILKSAKLPRHLAEKPYLKENYGQVDWSVKALYQQNLGWFDADARNLYPISSEQAAERMVRLAGGAQKVRAEIDTALKNNEPRWAVHLITMLQKSNAIDVKEGNLLLAQGLTAIANTVDNTNGKAYLLASSRQLDESYVPPAIPDISREFMDAIPVETFVYGLTSRLNAPEALDVHQTIAIRMDDVKETFYLTIRRGVVEISKNTKVPGAPEPMATLVVDSTIWKMMALQKVDRTAMLLKGELSVEGDVLDLQRFMGRFDKGM
ncbi:MAG: hypothetical protein CMH56_01485 [Myxococcales bacterium]|nr:hypothetical protein [Myxococcales bacterium]